jgi:tetratricopeptide (TPR) repeat protein
MTHFTPASPPRGRWLRAVAIVAALPFGPVPATEADPTRTTETAAVEPSDPATWPRFALTEARQAAADIEHPHRRAQALEQIASTSSGLGDCAVARTILAEAIEVARSIADVSLRDLALRDIARRQAACKDVSGALGTFKEMSSPDERDAVALAVVSVQLEAGELSEALQTADLITDPITISDAERLIAIAHAQRGRMSEARHIAERIPDFLVRAMSMADIAALHADVGNAQALNTARLVARNTPNARQRDVALSYVAAIQAQSGDVHGALATSAVIKDGTSKAYALTRIASVRTDTPDDAAVPDLLNRAWTAARRAKPSTATAAVLCEIAEAFVVRGDTSQARAALDQALSIATGKRAVRTSSATIEKLARVRARTGDIAGALLVAERVADGSSRALLIHDVLAAQAETGDVDGAIKSAGALNDPRLQVAGMFGIVGVQMTSGHVSEARASLDRVLEISRATSDPGFRAHSLGAVAAAQVELGDRAQAWPNFQEALVAAGAVADPYARVFALVNLSDPFTLRP